MFENTAKFRNSIARLNQAGQVTNVKIVYDCETGCNKQFGFCDFADQASAQNAVNTLNGADFNGCSIRVNFAYKN
ncbi:hypothetical protein TELCIR_11237 [Teladorsagia circumcincta]|uniref:RRM domain-containing protein n=1 Tax=Teladorsagia circumcincta TaxID=45464 RepID=A0A2G9UBA7_TELCI|nr:hypothetical protein TELCIR_11237 [Teladorsagia circumcincta]